MIRVKAKYHFLDKKACRNRMQGDIFTAPDDWVDELVKAGLVEPVESKNEPDNKVDSTSEEHKERARTTKNQKK